MKKLFYILILITGMTNAQIVNIPDANFKAFLISNGFDTNADGQIQESEALSVINLYVSNEPLITSLEGLSSFTNLTSLIISNLPQLTDIDASNLTNVVGFSFNDLPLISSLDLTGCTSLTSFYINNNMPNVTSINVSGLTNLENFYIHGSPYTGPVMNLTSLNLSGCTGLKYLVVNHTLLEAIDVSDCVALENITCGDNNILNLDFSGLPNLLTVDVGANGESFTLLSLNVNGCTALNSINAWGNNFLETIYMKNGRNESIFLTGCYNLSYICADESQLAAVQTHLNNLNQSSTVCVLNSYCSFTPGGNYNTISGTVTLDANNNGCDSNDIFQPNIRVNINDGTNQGATYTNNAGNYNFYTQAGSFDLTPNIENPTWFTFSPTTATIPFADNNNNSATQNFCISANGIHPDVEIVIAPITPARPGFDATYKIVYKNKGNQTLSGNVSFSYDDAVLDFVSATVVLNPQSVGTLSWNYTNLLPFESRSIVITLNVNAPTETPAVNIGDQLDFNATITPIASDEIPADNVFLLKQIVVGSYDPNDITCLEGDIVAPSEIGNYLHYNIRFENTGTAAAEFVVVKVEVNQTDFDMNSLQIMNSSDPVYARINQNIVEFIFQNIQLESGGHGNILLKIKSKNNLLVGDEVNKKANIYFDYNFPILTNDAETVFQSLSNPDFQNDASISVYPNPTNGIVTVNGNNSIKSIQLYDVQGRLLQTNLVNENETTIDVSTKSKGVYFLKILSDKGMKVEKIVRE